MLVWIIGEQAKRARHY